MQMLTEHLRKTESPPTSHEPDVARVLTVPGLDGSGPRHWQSYWEHLSGFRRVVMPEEARPRFHVWLPALDTAIRLSARPVVIAAHSLGCLALAWWAAMLSGEKADRLVHAALLVAPPDVDGLETSERIRDFRPTPRWQLPFPSILVASRNDPFAAYERSEQMAANWGSQLVDAGKAGHLNAESGLAEWPAGLRLLCGLSGHNANRLVAELGLRVALA